MVGGLADVCTKLADVCTKSKLADVCTKWADPVLNRTNVSHPRCPLGLNGIPPWHKDFVEIICTFGGLQDNHGHPDTWVP